MNSRFDQLHCSFCVSPVKMFLVFISVERNRKWLFHTKCLKIDAPKHPHNLFIFIYNIYGMQLQIMYAFMADEIIVLKLKETCSSPIKVFQNLFLEGKQMYLSWKFLNKTFQVIRMWRKGEHSGETAWWIQTSVAKYSS